MRLMTKSEKVSRSNQNNTRGIIFNKFTTFHLSMTDQEQKHRILLNHNAFWS